MSPPEAGSEEDAGVTVARHSAASCTIVAATVLTSMVARRLLGALFAATRYAIDPSPWPFDSDVITIHCAVLEAAHVQSRAALTVSVPAPPAAGTFPSELATVTPQRGAVGAVTDVFDEVQDADAATRTMRMWRHAAAHRPAVAPPTLIRTIAG